MAGSGQAQLAALLQQQVSVSMIKPGDQTLQRKSSSMHKTSSSKKIPSHASPAKTKTAMQRLDAADGKLDGKYFGKSVAAVDSPPPRSAPAFPIRAPSYDLIPDDGDEAVQKCGQQDSEDPDRICMHTCLGSAALRRHQIDCPFSEKKCPNEKCGITMSNRHLTLHLSMCKYQKLECLMCQARYYRMDADYHHSICPEKEIKCPLSCGMVLPRGDLLEHIQMNFMRHSFEILESQDYLPEDHPSRVYGLLLRQLKDLRSQLEIAMKPCLLQVKDPNLSPIYTPSKMYAKSPQYDNRGSGGYSRPIDDYPVEEFDQPDFMNEPGAESEWLKRYDYAMYSLRDLRERMQQGGRPDDITRDYRVAAGTAEELIEEMVSVQNHHAGQVSNQMITMDDVMLTLEELHEHLDAMTALLQTVQREHDRYGPSNAYGAVVVDSDEDFDMESV